MWSTVISAPFAVFVFAFNSVPMLLVGIALWGVGMGAQESILKAAVTSMVPKTSRATGYGIFECSFGAFWFLGSWLMGVLYDASIPAMIAVSVAAQPAAIPRVYRLCKAKKERLIIRNIEKHSLPVTERPCFLLMLCCIMRPLLASS